MPLNDLTERRKNEKIEWTEERQEAFEKLKIKIAIVVGTFVQQIRVVRK